MKTMSIKDQTCPQIERVTNSIMKLDWRNREIYGDFLAQTYFHICHSTRLLAAAGSRFPLSQEALHLQCMSHASEERSHEKLSLADLKALNLSLKDFPELPATKSLYRSTYFLIDRASPIALFGYAYFLEWMAVEAGTKIYEIAHPCFGPKATKHLHVHTKEDPAHIEAYEQKLDDFSGSERDTILEAIATTAVEYERMYAEISARSANLGKLKLAA